MSVKKIIKNLFLIFIMVGWCIIVGGFIIVANLLISEKAHSAEINGMATIEIVTPVSVSSASDVDFGTIIKEGDNLSIYRIYPSGEILKSPDIRTINEPRVGEYIINSYGDNLQVSVQILNSSKDIFVSSLILDYNGRTLYASQNTNPTFTVATGVNKRLLVGGTYSINGQHPGKHISEYNIVLEAE